MVFGASNKEDILKIQARLETIEVEQKSSLEKLKEHIDKKFQSIVENFEGLKQKQVFYFEEYDKALTTLNDINIRYKKEFENLNLTKNNLTEKVLEKLERELKESLKEHFLKLDNEKAKFESLTKEIEILKEEIRRITSLAEKIKSADLELVKHSQELERRDDEKTRLLKRIDDLQSLIGKIRRGEHS